LFEDKVFKDRLIKFLFYDDSFRMFGLAIGQGCGTVRDFKAVREFTEGGSAGRQGQGA
jgi:hypothetical protein